MSDIKIPGVFFGSPKKKTVDKVEEKVDNVTKQEFNPTARAYGYAKSGNTYDMFVVDIDVETNEARVTNRIKTKFDAEYRIIAELNKLQAADDKRK
jgi:hypothetical protein